MASFTTRTIARAVKRGAYTATGKRRGREPILTKLPNNAHFSGSIFTNANWFDAVLEFLPTPVPVNLRYEAVEC